MSPKPHAVRPGDSPFSYGMGAESLTWDGRLAQSAEPLPCVKIAEYAAAVIKASATEFDARTVESVNPTFHVVLTARSISVEGGDDRAPLLTREELERSAQDDPKKTGNVFGASPLFHPVRHLTTSLHEWVRYPLPPITNLLEGQAYSGDLVVRTENTTFAYMPGSPEWLIDEYEDMIEFVASVPPLLTLLENRMRDLDGRISDDVIRREQRDAAEKVEKKPQARAERLERPVKIVGGVLGVAALAEVLSWLNDVYRVGGPAWAWGEAALLVVVATLALYLYASTRR